VIPSICLSSWASKHLDGGGILVWNLLMIYFG
jgi:hypothetical protein